MRFSSKNFLESIDQLEGLAERIIQCNSTYTIRFGVRLRGRMNSFISWRSVRSEYAAVLDRMTGKEFLADIRDEFLEGGAEVDLVRSGLEDVMRSTWARIADLLQEQPELGDFRTAAYVASIRQVAEAYEAIGIQFGDLS